MNLLTQKMTGLMAMPAVLVCMALPASAAWQEPTAGWEAVYDASSTLLPWELSGTGTDKAWVNQIPRDATTQGFLSADPNVPNYAGVVTDEASSLAAMEINTTGVGNAIAALQIPPGSGTNADLLTIDFKFRLHSDLPTGTAYGDLPTTFPLLLTISRPPTAGQITAKPGANEQFWQLRLRKQNVFALGANSSGGNQNQSGSTQLSNEWHELRFQVDVATGAASVYLDGSDTPDITDLYARTNILSDPALVDNSIYFGTAGSGISGVASIEYVKVTTSELVAVPEPAMLGLLATGSLVMLGRRRA